MEAQPMRGGRQRTEAIGNLIDEIADAQGRIGRAQDAGLGVGVVFDDLPSLGR